MNTEMLISQTEVTDASAVACVHATAYASVSTWHLSATGFEAKRTGFNPIASRGVGGTS